MSDEPKLVSVSIADLPDREFHDGDYRRGYFQGYFQALEDVSTHEKTVSQCQDFLYDKLCQWRYKDRIDKFICPPEVWHKSTVKQRTAPEFVQKLHESRDHK